MKKVDPETWAEFRRYCRTKHPRQLSPVTIKETIRKLRHLERKGVNLINFDPEIVYEIFEEKLDDGVSNSGINQYVKSLNRWLAFRNTNYKFNRYKEHDKPIRIPTLKEMGDMIKVYDKRNREHRLKRFLLTTLYHTGLRPMEICSLTFGDIDWVRKVITVCGKGGKYRIIPVSETFLFGKTYPSLNNYLVNWRYKPLPNHRNYVFIKRNGKRVTQDYLRKTVKYAARQVGIEWVNPYSFRHFFATNLLRNKVNIRVVQELMGHSDIKTTARYLHIVETDLRNAISKLDNPIKFKGGLQSKLNHLYTHCNALSDKNYGPARI